MNSFYARLAILLALGQCYTPAKATNFFAWCLSPLGAAVRFVACLGSSPAEVSPAAVRSADDLQRKLLVKAGLLVIEGYVAAHLRQPAEDPKATAVAAHWFLQEDERSPLQILAAAVAEDERLAPIVKEISDDLDERGQKVVWSDMPNTEYHRLNQTIYLSPLILSTPNWISQIIISIQHYSGHNNENFLVTSRDMSFGEFIGTKRRVSPEVVPLTNTDRYVANEIDCILEAFERALELENLGLTTVDNHFSFNVETAREVVKKFSGEGEHLKKRENFALLFDREILLVNGGNHYLHHRWQLEMETLDRDFILTKIRGRTGRDLVLFVSEFLFDSAARKDLNLTQKEYFFRLFPQAPDKGVSPQLAYVWENYNGLMR